MSNLFQISSIKLANFGADASSDPRRDGTIPVYDGSTLYCHINPDPNDNTKVKIAFDQVPPNEFKAAGNQSVSIVTLAFVFNNVEKMITWNTGLPTGLYSGKKLMPYLSFADNMKSATLVLDNNNEIPQIDVPRAQAKRKPNAKAKSEGDDPNNIPTLGVVIVGPELTGHEARGYFVSVPLAKIAENPDFREVILARVKWPKPESVSGPIGSVNVP